jgi:hypothetical protein
LIDSEIVFASLGKQNKKQTEAIRQLPSKPKMIFYTIVVLLSSEQTKPGYRAASFYPGLRADHQQPASQLSG